MLTAFLIVLAVLVVIGGLAGVVAVNAYFNDGSFLGYMVSWQLTEAIVKGTVYVLIAILKAIADASK